MNTPDSAAVNELARQLEQYLTTGNGEHLLTLGDGTVWRYYDGSNHWRAMNGRRCDSWAERPVRDDDTPLNAAELEGIRRVKHVAVTGSAPSEQGGAT